MKYKYPHTIKNGHGEEITFIARLISEEGDWLEVENKVQPGVGPPMHVHHQQDEILTVIQGRIAAQIDGQSPTFHGPGETLTFNRGVAHRFWNAGTDVLICKGRITPAHNVEYFLTELFHSIANNTSSRPGLFDGVYLQSKYKSEFDLTEIPALVKAIIFPLIMIIGRISGHHSKFVNAPAPMPPSKKRTNW